MARENPSDRSERALANRQGDLHLIIEDIHRDANASGIMRTAEAVGVGTIHIIKTDGLNQSVLPRVSRGAERWLEIESHAEPGTCIARLHAQGLAVYCAAVTPEAVDFRSVDYARPCAIAVGNETEGASGSLAALADEVIMIPMMGLTESLNVGAAAAVILYEAQRQRAEAGMYMTQGLDADAPDNHGGRSPCDT